MVHERDALVNARRSGEHDRIGDQLIEPINLSQQRLQARERADDLDGDRDNEDHVAIAVEDWAQGEHVVEFTVVLAVVEQPHMCLRPSTHCLCNGRDGLGICLRSLQESARPPNHVFKGVAGDPSVAFIRMNDRSTTDRGVADADADGLHVCHARYEQAHPLIGVPWQRIDAARELLSKLCLCVAFCSQ